MSESTDPAEPAAFPLISAPADGLPPVIAEERDLDDAAAAIAGGTGPVALDVERASGYRYGQHAYLVQVRRAGAGSFLIDPVGVPDLEPLARAIGDAEWILHAATQDIPSLALLGLHPASLFDTELGARIAGLPRVGLAAVIEHYLGVTLAKEHSAVDWSTRPLPQDWLTYAALDVELLIPLREAMRADLEAQGKLEWALQDFAHLTHFEGPQQRTEPWRRTSGMHRIRNRRAAGTLRELWQMRDDIARRRDVSPGRVMSDAHLVAVAVAMPKDAEGVQRAVADVNPKSRSGRGAGRGVARLMPAVLAAVDAGRAVPESQLPPLTVASDAPPPVRAWADRNPVAAARLTEVRARLTTLAEELHLPIENLISPDPLRRVIWSPPSDHLDDDALAAELDARFAALAARPWQRSFVIPLTLRVFRELPEETEE